jgi:HrpA-like RNA helicase
VRKRPLIVVTQPRRIAAVSLAQYPLVIIFLKKDLLLRMERYVSNQRGEGLMKSIGYAIGNDRHYNESCTLLFVTTGWLLQKLVFNPRFFDQCSHIFANGMIFIVLLSSLMKTTYNIR